MAELRDEANSEFDSADPANPTWVAIASFQSGAEAGFFADELANRLGLETEVVTRERFEAMHANWTIDFMLQVPPERVSEATGLLQELVAQTTDAEQPGGTNSAAGLTAGLWVPLVITLAAGSVVCFGIDRVDGRPPRRVRVQREEAPPAELWELLTAAPGPWVQPGGPGMGAKRVTFDRARKVAVIEEDLDGDGAIDRARELAWPAP